MKISFTKGIFFLIFVAAFCIFIAGFKQYQESNRKRTLIELVKELGKPSYLAVSAKVQSRRVEVLKIELSQIDPESIVNWSDIRNIVAVWPESEDCKRRARIFFYEMKNDKNFDGGAWYTSDSIFGEKLILANIDGEGNAVSINKVKVGAISSMIVGFVPNNKLQDEKGAPQD